jgi:selenide,water dikinase
MSTPTPPGSPSTAAPPRLSALAHGGGCGCKIAPGVLRGLLGQLPPGLRPPELLVGAETSDDAAVWQIDAHTALVATTDFFMPVVDDPRDFGRIAATNAISDVYAMGGRPILALALVGMPVNVLPAEVIAAVLAGGQEACAAAGVVVAGGHSIDSVEPIYGLAVIGLVHPDRVARNRSARPGDALVLGKGLGIGVFSAALKKGALPPEAYAEMIRSTTQLNTPGPALAAMPGVHAMTDVTGFGLLGHLHELCRGAGLDAELHSAAVPRLPGAEELLRAGFVTGASGRNLASLAGAIDGPGDPALMALLADPQTSGGLLVACDPAVVPEVIALFHEQGFHQAAQVGAMTHPSDSPQITLR